MLWYGLRCFWTILDVWTILLGAARRQSLRIRGYFGSTSMGISLYIPLQTSQIPNFRIFLPKRFRMSWYCIPTIFGMLWVHFWADCDVTDTFSLCLSSKSPDDGWKMTYFGNFRLFTHVCFQPNWHLKCVTLDDSASLVYPSIFHTSSWFFAMVLRRLKNIS